jgi:hypothetical protein
VAMSTRPASRRLSTDRSVTCVPLRRAGAPLILMMGRVTRFAIAGRVHEAAPLALEPCDASKEDSRGVMLASTAHSGRGVPHIRDRI